MTTLVSPPSDPATLAAAVRTLARRAHRLLNDPAPQPTEIRSLLQQARRLREHVRGWRSDELRLWLEHVQQRLEAAC